MAAKMKPVILHLPRLLHNAIRSMLSPPHPVEYQLSPVLAWLTRQAPMIPPYVLAPTVLVRQGSLIKYTHDCSTQKAKDRFVLVTASPQVP